MRRWLTYGAATLLAVLAGAGACSWRQPDPAAYREERVPLERTRLRERSPALPEGPLTLRAAVEYALAHNLDASLARREVAIRREEASGAARDLLFDLDLSYTKKEVHDPKASSSESLKTGKESLEPSVSTEQNTNQQGLGAVWNVLDFGLGYLKARQARHRTAIEAARVDRQRQKLALEVTEAYGRLAVAQEAAAEARGLLTRIDERLERLASSQDEHGQSDVDRLENKKRLLQMRARLNRYEQEAGKARVALARRLGCDVEAGIRVVPLAGQVGADRRISDFYHERMDLLEAEALRQRPEMGESDRREFIAADEVRAAALRMLPHVDIMATRDYDSNKYLYRHYWTTYSLDVAWNLLSLPQKQSQRRAAAGLLALEREKRLAVATGVLAQVRLAVLDLEDAEQRLADAGELAATHAELADALARRLEEGEASEDAVTSARADALLADAQRRQALAGLLAARGRLFNTLGRSPLAIAHAPDADADAAEADPGRRVGAVLRAVYGKTYPAVELARMRGLLIHASDDAGGRWEYCAPDAADWRAVDGALSAGGPLRLRRGARLRFVRTDPQAATRANLRFSPWVN